MLAIMCQMSPVYIFVLCFGKYELNIVVYQRFKMAFIIQAFLLKFHFISVLLLP